MSKKIDDLSIAKYFDASPSRVYTATQIAEIHASHKTEWQLPSAMSSRKFLQYLLDNTKLREVTLTSKEYAP